jgi:hypothetical protein
MPRREIPKQEWSAFFTSFNRVHVGWLCTLEVRSRDFGAKLAARNLPLTGIGTDAGQNEPPLRITLGDPRGAHVSHAIDVAEHVWIKQTDEGADEGLEIDAPNVTTLLTFRVAALPETVDGVV